jgi:hypothetical protein
MVKIQENKICPHCRFHNADMSWCAHPEIMKPDGNPKSLYSSEIPDWCPLPDKEDNSKLFQNIKFKMGFTIDIIPNQLIQKGKGILMINPSDEPNKEKV